MDILVPLLLFHVKNQATTSSAPRRSRQRRRPRYFKTRLGLEDFTDVETIQHFRLDKRAIMELFAKIKHKLERQTRRSRALNGMTKLLSVLHYLASGSFQYCVASKMGFTQPTFSRILRQVVEAINSLSPNYIRLPYGREEITAMKQKFFQKYGFPKTIGLIDCTHIALLPQNSIESSYRNRKHYHSLNVQVVCGPQSEILDIVAKYPGGTHDSFILTNSGIGNLFQSGYFQDAILLVPSDWRPKSNVYVGLQPISPPLLDGRKTPPPVPYRKKVSTDLGIPTPPIRNSMYCFTNRGQTEQPTILIGSSAQNSRPPVPDRKTKPSFNKPYVVTPPETLEYDYVALEESRPNDLRFSKMIQDDQIYVDSRNVNPTDVAPIVQNCMITPPVHQMSDQAQGLAVAPNDHCYLAILPALPIEVEMQGKPLKPPDRPMAPSSDQTQGVTEAPNDHCYLAILPALPIEVEMQGKPLKPPDRPMAPSSVPPIDRLPANCNILLLNIGKIVQDSETPIQDPPLLCSGCSSACSKLNHINDTKTWTCVFCAAENPLPDDNTFVSREVGDELYVGDLQAENEYSFADQTMIIFCIDISGSMSVTPEVTQEQSNDYNIVYKTRMEAVKSALDQTLDFLHEQHSQKRVGLVTFSDQVKLYGDGTREPLVLQGAELLDPDYLKSQGEGQAMPHPLVETLYDLKGKIQCLEETGATALGPAALVSIAMASKSPGSKVIICTDGRANTDLGNLEDISDEYAYQSSKLYYSNLGDLALQHSVVVSVVTIEGTNCRLPELGQLADKTGGKVNIVHPLKLANEFQSIIEEEIIATNVKLKVFLPNTMYFLYEETVSVLEKTFGSTTADTVLSTEFNTHSSKIKEVLRYSQLPIQLHLSYTLPDGRSRRRILSDRRPVTNDCTSALETIDLSVLQTHSVQFSARLAMEGHVNEARNVALELKELIDLVMRHEKYEAPGVVYEDWEDSMAPIYEDLQVYMKEKSPGETGQDSHKDVPVVKTFSDEMAQMIFHMKRAKNRVLNKIRSQTVKNGNEL